MDGPIDRTGPVGTGGAGAGPAGTGGGASGGSGGGSAGTGGRGSGGSAPGSGGSTPGSGGTNPGSGGSAPGSGGSAPGSGGAIVPPPCAGAMESTVATNGYFDNGTWHGYAYTFGPAGQVSPACPTPCYQQSGKYLCASGTLAADPTFSSVVGFGWNVNQPTSSTPVGAVTPTGTGVRINAPGATTSMRIDINDGVNHWCAQLPAVGGGAIPWSMFRRECWAGGVNEQYPMLPFHKMEILVPSSAAQAIPYCVCVVSVNNY
jgi:hypothetical protein